MTEELWETAYFDLVKLLVVDHPIGTEIFTDERYTPPPFPGVQDLHSERDSLPTYSARPSWIRCLRLHSRRSITATRLNTSRGCFKALLILTFIVLDLGDVPDDQGLTLFLTGWIFPTDTSINISLSQNPSINPAFPYLQVL